MPDFSDRYNTPIPPEKQPAYNQWRSALPAPLQSQRDYDLQGAFLSGAGQSANAHFTDQFKKPNHPTFSEESKYHGVDGNAGGAWIDAPGRRFYQPSKTNLQYQSQTALGKYFADPRHGDTDVTPLPPSDVPALPTELPAAPSYRPRPAVK